jgi:hypothetical protein
MTLTSVLGNYPENCALQWQGLHRCLMRSGAARMALLLLIGESTFDRQNSMKEVYERKQWSTRLHYFEGSSGK